MKRISQVVPMIFGRSGGVTVNPCTAIGKGHKSGCCMVARECPDSGRAGPSLFIPRSAADGWNHVIPEAGAERPAAAKWRYHNGGTRTAPTIIVLQKQWRCERDEESGVRK